MPLTGSELLSDVPDLMAIGMKIEQRVAALPPQAQCKAVDYAVAAGLPPGSPGYGTFAMVDAIEAALAALPPKAQRTATDYAKLAGFADDSPVLDTFKLVDKIRTQVAS
jgi:hypothetical protein